MGKQGVYRRILRSLKARTNQADKCSTESVPLEQQLIDAQVWLDTILRLPPSEFGIKIANGVIVQHSIDAKDISIAKAQARVAGLKTRIRLTQRLNQTGSQTERARTLQDHPSKTNDGGTE